MNNFPAIFYHDSHLIDLMRSFVNYDRKSEIEYGVTSIGVHLRDIGKDMSASDYLCDQVTLHVCLKGVSLRRWSRNPTFLNEGKPKSTPSPAKVF